MAVAHRHKAQGTRQSTRLKAQLSLRAWNLCLVCAWALRASARRDDHECLEESHGNSALRRRLIFPVMGGTDEKGVKARIQRPANDRLDNGPSLIDDDIQDAARANAPADHEHGR